MAKNKNSVAKTGGILTPSQQWLALSLLALLAVVAVFYFGIGGINGGYGGHGG